MAGSVAAGGAGKERGCEGKGAVEVMARGEKGKGWRAEMKGWGGDVGVLGR